VEKAFIQISQQDLKSIFPFIMYEWWKFDTCLLYSCWGGLIGVVVSMGINHHKCQNREYKIEMGDENNDGRPDFKFECREGYGSYTFLNKGDGVYFLKDE